MAQGGVVAAHDVVGRLVVPGEQGSRVQFVGGRVGCEVQAATLVGLQGSDVFFEKWFGQRRAEALPFKTELNQAVEFRGRQLMADREPILRCADFLAVAFADVSEQFLFRRRCGKGVGIAGGLPETAPEKRQPVAYLVVQILLESGEVWGELFEQGFVQAGFIIEVAEFGQEVGAHKFAEPGHGDVRPVPAFFQKPGQCCDGFAVFGNERGVPFTVFAHGIEVPGLHKQRQIGRRCGKLFVCCLIFHDEAAKVGPGRRFW